MTRVSLFLGALLLSPPAFAQGLYVGFAAGSDSVLVSHAETETELLPFLDQGGTVPTFALRVGLPVGGRWGVELEGAHSLALEKSFDLSRVLLQGSSFTFSSSSDFPLPGTQILRPQPIAITSETERSVTAVNAVGWVRYTLGARLDLAFLGGATFTRRTTEQRYSFPRPSLPPGFPPDLLPIIQPSARRLITYDVGPLIGAEAWLAFGDHIRVVPGVRLSAVAAEWSVRPTAGVAWVF
jgi:hypothetical protein